MKTFAEPTEAPETEATGENQPCSKPLTCPLSRVKAGMAVRIKTLTAPPEVTKRLREIGFGEEQVIKLLIHQTNLICQVCNARLAVSAQLAQLIMVEPLVPAFARARRQAPR
jgi:Fe2+ transport system protein FeoA